MKKKLISLVAVFAILFGGAFASTVSASTSEQPQKLYTYKIFYSFNDVFGNVSGNDWVNQLVNQFQQKYQWQNKKVNKQDSTTKDQVTEEKKEEKKQEPKAEQPKQEQPKQEQPKQEQPKQEQPKQEQPKQEQPKQEQTKQEQTKQEQPKQEEVKEPVQEKDTETNANDLNQFEQQVVELTNQERSKHGLQPLQVDQALSKVAREKSRDMATNNYFAHNSPTYGSPFDMMNQFEIDYRTAGENIAKGQRSPQQVVNAWMNSEGHRANILNGNYTHIGVGYVEQGNHWTQQFIGK